MRTGSAHAPTGTAVHIGRQPIHAADGSLHAYELLFRDATNATGASQGGDAATTATILAAFAEFGADDLLGGRPGFINLTRAFMVGHLPVPFGPESAVLEILENIEIDAELVAGSHALTEQGYRLALDDFVWSPEAEPLLDLAEIVKIDVLSLTWDEVINTARRCRERQVRLLAEKVEDAAMLDRCREAGFELFQGYHLGRPEVLSAQSLSPNQLTSLQLVARLGDPDVTIAEVERLVRLDPALTYRLLRIVNSASGGLTREVSSIRDAVMMVGVARLRAWMVLSTLGGSSQGEDAPLSTALVRAHTCELLAGEVSGVRAEVAFTLGLLDGVAERLGDTGAGLCDRLPTLNTELAAALRGTAGPLRSVLDAVLAHERQDHADVAAHGQRSDEVSQAYLRSLRWSNEVLGAAVRAG
jgi:EAL and modified HD-GYP domain-containing signal transduction protein